MTLSEFRKATSILGKVRSELEHEAAQRGISLMSAEFDELLARVQEEAMNKMGYSMTEYLTTKQKDLLIPEEDKRMLSVIEDFKTGTDRRIQELVKEIKAMYIPTSQDIAAIASDVAQQYIVPPEPQIIKETIIEKPQIIQEIRIDEEKFNELSKKIDALPKEDLEKLKTEMMGEFQKHFKENIDILGMPNFRKLAMGLQAQIDALGTGNVTGPASATANNVAIFNGTTGKIIKDSGLALSGTNTGDQTTIVGITGTMAQFNTAVSDGDIVYQGQVLTGSITLGENTSIALDPAGSADGKYSGITIAGTGGATIAFGRLVYLKAADSRWYETDADALSTSGNIMIGMTATSTTSGSAVTILLMGQIRADASFPALTVGAAVYAGETAGDIQVAIPTGADNVIRVVGFALTADEIYFNPSQDHQTTVA